MGIEEGTNMDDEECRGLVEGFWWMGVGGGGGMEGGEGWWWLWQGTGTKVREV